MVEYTCFILTSEGKNMNITATKLDANYQAGGDMYAIGRYTLHNIDVYNEITIDNELYTAVYQTGVSFLHNDFKYPNTELELSQEGGASDVLCVINSLYESDFDDDEFINDVLLGLSEDCKSIKTHVDLYQAWDFLRNQQPVIGDWI